MSSPGFEAPRHCEECSDYAAIQGPPGSNPSPRSPWIATPRTARDDKLPVTARDGNQSLTDGGDTSPAAVRSDGRPTLEPAAPLTPDRLERLLTLNNAHATELSLLDADHLAHLLSQAFWTARIGDVDAFMLTLDQSAGYDSPNHRWFRDRYPRFAYVDRIAVAPAARGRGLARALYAGAIQAAAAAGHTAIMAEVNSNPPNPASDALHAALGFQQVGAAPIHGGAKTVRYLMRPLP